jgi:hypothetical protein
MAYIQLYAEQSDTDVHVISTPEGDVVIEMEREEDGSHARFSREQALVIAGFLLAGGGET